MDAAACRCFQALSDTHPASRLCSYLSASPFQPIGAGNPFQLAFMFGTQAYTAAVYR